MYLRISFLFHISMCAYFLACNGCASMEHQEIKPNFKILNNVLNVCDANGKKFLTVTSFSNGGSHRKILHPASTFFSFIQKRKLYARYLEPDEALLQTDVRQIDNTIILVDYKSIHNNETSVLTDFITLISKTKIRSSILAISTIVDASPNTKIKLDPIISTLSKLQQNMFFYIVHDFRFPNGTIGFMWNQVITLQSNPKVILNSMLFDSRNRIVER